jgi:hypothetical protein
VIKMECRFQACYYRASHSQKLRYWSADRRAVAKHPVHVLGSEVLAACVVTAMKESVG